MQYKLYRVIIMMYICIVLVLGNNILYGDETVVLPTHHENSNSDNKISSKKYLYKAICFGAVCLSSVGVLAGSIFSEVLPENLTLPTSTSYPSKKIESLINYNEYKLKYSKRAFLVNSLVQECTQIDRLIKDALENELRSEEEKEKFKKFYQKFFTNHCQSYMDPLLPVELSKIRYQDSDIGVNFDLTSVLLSLSGVSLSIATPFSLCYLFKYSKKKPNVNKLIFILNFCKRKYSARAKILLSLLSGYAQFQTAYSEESVRLLKEITFDDIQEAGFDNQLQEHVQKYNDNTKDKISIEEEIELIEKDFYGSEVVYIMMSDPQLPWVKSFDHLSREQIIEDGIDTNRRHIASMNTLNKIENKFNNTKGVIINGDLTAFGHAWQWTLFLRLYKNYRKDKVLENIDLPIYPGLGNHDYENNVKDCYGPWYSILKDKSNWCAKQSIRELISMVREVSIVNFHQGSYSYSWDEDGFHFVQLNNSPNYKEESLGVTDSLEWLNDDLADATKNNKKIILNFHKPEISERLRNIIRKYPVIGVFYGHIHSKVGADRALFSSVGQISTYYCGSASHNLYNVISLNAHRMDVYSINSTTGRPIVIDLYTQTYN